MIGTNRNVVLILTVAACGISTSCSPEQETKEAAKAANAGLDQIWSSHAVTLETSPKCTGSVWPSRLVNHTKKNAYAVICRVTVTPGSKVTREFQQVDLRPEESKDLPCHAALYGQQLSLDWAGWAPPASSNLEKPENAMLRRKGNGTWTLVYNLHKFKTLQITYRIKSHQPRETENVEPMDSVIIHETNGVIDAVRYPFGYQHSQNNPLLCRTATEREGAK